LKQKLRLLASLLTKQNICSIINALRRGGYKPPHRSFLSAVPRTLTTELVGAQYAAPLPTGVDDCGRRRFGESRPVEGNVGEDAKVFEEICEVGDVFCGCDWAQLCLKLDWNYGIRVTCNMYVTFSDGKSDRLDNLVPLNCNPIFKMSCSLRQPSCNEEFPV